MIPTPAKRIFVMAVESKKIDGEAVTPKRLRAFTDRNALAEGLEQLYFEDDEPGSLDVWEYARVRKRVATLKINKRLVLV